MDPIGQMYELPFPDALFTTSVNFSALTETQQAMFRNERLLNTARERIVAVSAPDWSGAEGEMFTDRARYIGDWLADVSNIIHELYWALTSVDLEWSRFMSNFKSIRDDAEQAWLNARHAARERNLIIADIVSVQAMFEAIGVATQSLRLHEELQNAQERFEHADEEYNRLRDIADHFRQEEIGAAEDLTADLERLTARTNDLAQTVAHGIPPTCTTESVVHVDVVSVRAAVTALRVALAAVPHLYEVEPGYNDDVVNDVSCDMATALFSVVAAVRVRATELTELTETAIRAYLRSDFDWAFNWCYVWSEPFEPPATPSSEDYDWNRNVLTIPDVVPTRATPDQVMMWWHTLSDTQRTTMLAEHPELLGNLTGLSAIVRHAANIKRLQRQRHFDRERLTILADELVSNSNLTDATSSTLRDEQRAVHERLESMNALDAVLNRGGRTLLKLEFTYGHTEATVAIGDIDTADRVAVFMPDKQINVSEIGGCDTQVQGLLTDAVREAGRETVAAVIFFGYKAPQVGSGTNRPVLDDGAIVSANDFMKLIDGISVANEAAQITVAARACCSVSAGASSTTSANGGVDQLTVCDSHTGLPDDRNDDQQITDELHRTRHEPQ